MTHIPLYDSTTHYESRVMSHENSDMKTETSFHENTLPTRSVFGLFWGYMCVLQCVAVRVAVCVAVDLQFSCRTRHIHSRDVTRDHSVTFCIFFFYCNTLQLTAVQHVDRTALRPGVDGSHTCCSVMSHTCCSVVSHTCCSVMSQAFCSVMSHMLQCHVTHVAVSCHTHVAVSCHTCCSVMSHMLHCHVTRMLQCHVTHMLHCQ